MQYRVADSKFQKARDSLPVISAEVSKMLFESFMLFNVANY